MYVCVSCELVLDYIVIPPEPYQKPPYVGKASERPIPSIPYISCMCIIQWSM